MAAPTACLTPGPPSSTMALPRRLDFKMPWQAAPGHTLLVPPTPRQTGLPGSAVVDNGGPMSGPFARPMRRQRRA
jgi:hypothetical protein